MESKAILKLSFFATEPTSLRENIFSKKHKYKESFSIEHEGL